MNNIKINQFVNSVFNKVMDYYLEDDYSVRNLIWVIHSTSACAMWCFSNEFFNITPNNFSDSEISEIEERWLVLFNADLIKRCEVMIERKEFFRYSTGKHNY